jgi:hypothetical protein
VASRRALAADLARYLGAVSLVVVGIIHAQQYYYAYFSSVPTINTLFVLSFVGSAITAAVLLAPLDWIRVEIREAGLALAALSGIGIAAGSFVSLLYSEYYPLFGFMESGYRLAIELTLLFDSVTTVLLAAYLFELVRRYRARTAGRGGRVRDVASHAA